MALDTAPLLSRKRNLAFALETTNGTPASLAAADGVTAVFDPSMSFETEKVERQGQGSLSSIQQGRGARGGNCSFETELVGKGSSGLPIQSRLFQLVGLAFTSQVAAPITGPTQTGTIGYWTDGRLKRLSGCMGNLSIVFKRGQKARCKWTFQGVQQPPADTTQILPTYVTPVAPRCSAGAFTVGGTTYQIDEVTLDLGNVVILREDITAVDEASNPTGYRCAYITDRKPMLKFAPEALALATKNWYSFYQAGTTAAFSLAVGTTANNIITLAAPKIELSGDPQDGDRNGLLTDSLDFHALRNTDAGDDELSITWS